MAVLHCYVSLTVEYIYKKINSPTDIFVFGHCRFSIRKPPERKTFIVDLSVIACFVDGEECAPNVKIMDGTYLPQIICDIGAIVSIKSKNVYMF